MKNPYEHDWLEDEVRVGPVGLRLALAGFLLFLLLPAASLLLPSLRPEGPVPAGATLKEGLARWEDAAKTLPLLERWRRADQTRLGRFPGAGNRRVFSGRDGWLYYRPDLEAVFGKGPYHAEPPSVARERSARAWLSPVPVIEAFAAGLGERGIRLVFVPVPTKAMVCREGLGLAGGATLPPDWERLGRDLGKAGVEWVDLVPVITARGGDADRFLRQDTHWTPGTMEAAAREVAARLLPPGERVAPWRVETVERESRGDLVGMLDLGDEAASLFPSERVVLRRVVSAGAPPVISDGTAGVVVLGDSFVNVFEDPALGFGAEGEESVGAGFASHLALALGEAVQAIAINGGGASAVREAFAALPPERIAGVRTVVWVLSARDVLLPEIPARRAGIEWREVSFRGAGVSPPGPESGTLEWSATLRERSAIEDPRRTPYAEAVFSTLFEADDGTERNVFFWAFRERKPEPAAGLEPGRRYRLRLLPLDRAGERVNRATRLDDLFRADLDPWFAESFEAE